MTRRYHQASSSSKKVAQPDDGWAEQNGDNGGMDYFGINGDGGHGDNMGGTPNGATAGGTDAGK